MLVAASEAFLRCGQHSLTLPTDSNVHLRERCLHLVAYTIARIARMLDCVPEVLIWRCPDGPALQNYHGRV